MSKIPHGEPYAGKLHVRFDEGADVPYGGVSLYSTHLLPVRGIAKVNHELEKNGNARAQFDVNKRTEFRVTILASGKSEPINGRSEQTNGESEPINHHLKSINEPVNLTYDVKSHDAAVLSVIKQHPGIKKDGIFLEVKTSIMSIRRSLDRLKTAQKVEYRGSNKTGGWYVRT